MSQREVERLEAKLQAQIVTSLEYAERKQNEIATLTAQLAVTESSTADSLARIARVARYVIQERECYKAETEGKCYEEWKLVASKRVDAVRALTPEAIALIDALAGGA